jgi:hypothetical protein
MTVVKASVSVGDGDLRRKEVVEKTSCISLTTRRRSQVDPHGAMRSNWVFGRGDKDWLGKFHPIRLLAERYSVPRGMVVWEQESNAYGGCQQFGKVERGEKGGLTMVAPKRGA